MQCDEGFHATHDWMLDAKEPWGSGAGTMELGYRCHCSDDGEVCHWHNTDDTSGADQPFGLCPGCAPPNECAEVFDDLHVALVDPNCERTYDSSCAVWCKPGYGPADGGAEQRTYTCRHTAGSLPTWSPTNPDGSSAPPLVCASSDSSRA